ncbi:MAG: hypothetical protein C4322_08045, partial [Mastigocladus sp. ERB_26_1]
MNRKDAKCAKKEFSGRERTEDDSTNMQSRNVIKFCLALISLLMLLLFLFPLPAFAQAVRTP